MKKFITPILSVLLASGGIVSAAEHTYDFTNWSAETVDNLTADSNAGASTGWSDDEKNDGNKVNNKCFWMAGDNTAIGADGNLTANGTVIKELEGLDFSVNNSSRNLAIAVDYQETSLGTYNGAAYLWLGGSGKNYFTMKNVPAGSLITIGVESHKPSEARGIKLLVNGKELTAPDGSAVAAPKTFTEQTWRVSGYEGETSDVVVQNTNGCHLYYIDIVEGTPDVKEDPKEEEPSDPSHADALYYTDFNQNPAAWAEVYGAITTNTDIIAKNAKTTVTVAGITYSSTGSNGRVVAMNGNNNSTDSTKDYGPYTEEDAGASDRCIQLIEGGNNLYIEFPEVEGPATLTLYLANPETSAKTVKLTDEKGDTNDALASLELPAAKRMKKFVYEYPYKGTVKLRLYNMGKKVNVNDVLIEKGEGEGIEKPKDEKAPEVVYSWPAKGAYAPTEGIVVIEYNEDIVVNGQAEINGKLCDVTVAGAKATIVYSGLAKGESYQVTLPEISDEAGNVAANPALVINTAADDVLYYTDFDSYPYEYWNKYHQIYNGDTNGDILAKGSVDATAELAGITYYSGTDGRVVAMAKSNLISDAHESYDDKGTQRCIQLIGGKNGLYVQLPEVQGPCDVTLYVGNSTGNATSLTVKNGETELGTFEMDGKLMYKHTVSYKGTDKVALTLHNNGTQFNVHDILITKGTTTAIEGLEADENAEAVYYNLQGVRVANPSNGMYVRVRGNKVDKVVIR